MVVLNDRITWSARASACAACASASAYVCGSAGASACVCCACVPSRTLPASLHSTPFHSPPLAFDALYPAGRRLNNTELNNSNVFADRASSFRSLFSRNRRNGEGSKLRKQREAAEKRKQRGASAGEHARRCAPQGGGTIDDSAVEAYLSRTSANYSRRSGEGSPEREALAR